MSLANVKLCMDVSVVLSGSGPGHKHTGSYENGYLKASGAALLSFDLEFNRALTSLGLSLNNIGGMSWVNKGKLQGTTFKQGDTVQYNGQECMVFWGDDSNDLLKVQNISGVVALADGQPDWGWRRQSHSRRVTAVVSAPACCSPAIQIVFCLHPTNTYKFVIR